MSAGYSASSDAEAETRDAEFDRCYAQAAAIDRSYQLQREDAVRAFYDELNECTPNTTPIGVIAASEVAGMSIQTCVDGAATAISEGLDE